MTLIYDVNNWIRVKLSTDGDQLTILSFWNEVLYNSQRGEIQIFVSDGFNSRKRRKEIYPEYKAKRKPADISIYDGINFFKNLLRHAPKNVFYVELPEVEADDVIAHLVKHSHDYFLPKPIDIISTDKDLTQLMVHNGVRTLGKAPVDPKYVRLYKTLVGDSSDNIPGVEKLGPSAWHKLPEGLLEQLDNLFKYEQDLTSGLCNELELCLKKKQLENFFESYYNGTLQMFYKIVGFFDFPINFDILKQGDGDLEYVNRELNDLFII